MSNRSNVIKRNGEVEILNLDKMHVMVEEACRGISGVSASQVEMKSGIQFYDGITTKEIQEILIRSASDLIDLDHPNYQYVAARLLLFSIRKQLYARQFELPHLEDHIINCVNVEVYDNEIFTKYSKEEIDKVNSFIDHDRDLLFTYAGLRQVVDKYLVQDRSSGGVYETPQFMYIMIALTIFAEYPKQTRLLYVKRYYDAISKHKINIPTPIMAGLEPHFANLQVVFLLMSMIPCVVSSQVMLLFLGTLLKELELVSTQVESGVSTAKSEGEKLFIQVLSHSSKSLKQLLEVVHRTGFAVEVLRSTFQSGTKK